MTDQLLYDINNQYFIPSYLPAIIKKESIILDGVPNREHLYVQISCWNVEPIFANGEVKPEIFEIPVNELFLDDNTFVGNYEDVLDDYLLRAEKPIFYVSVKFIKQDNEFLPNQLSFNKEEGYPDDGIVYFKTKKLHLSNVVAYIMSLKKKLPSQLLNDFAKCTLVLSPTGRHVALNISGYLFGDFPEEESLKSFDKTVYFIWKQHLSDQGESHIPPENVSVELKFYK